MMKFQYLLILLFFISIPFLSLAQDIDNQPLHFDHLTINEGLSHNTVYCMLQDKYGYIWIGTQNGLNKYDGYSFDVYRENDDEKNNFNFKGKIITALFEDSKGNIWVGTRKNGINLKVNSTNQFTNLNSDTLYNDIKGAWVTSIFEDTEENIWIATHGEGLLKYNPQSQTTQHFSTSKNNISNDIVFDINEDKYGTIWAATINNGLDYLKKNDSNKNKFNHFLHFPNRGGYRKNILVYDNKLWICSEGSGVYILDIETEKFQHLSEGNSPENLSSHLVRDIHKGPNNEIYIATDGGGLNIYQETKGISKSLHYPNRSTSLNSNALFCFLEDRTGNIWIGSYNGGINIHKKNKTWFDFFTPHLNQQEKQENKSILAIHEDHNNRIWLGTDGGGLILLDENKNQLETPTSPNSNSSIGSKVVKSIFEDSKHNLWIGSFGEGVDMYNPKTKSIKKYRDNSTQNSLKGNSVWSIAEDADENIWLGTLGAGINVLDTKTNQFNQLYNDQNDPKSLPDNNIMVITKDKEDRIWIGTMDEGLALWNKDKSGFTNFKNIPNNTSSISGDEIRAMYCDKKGNLWIGTEGGGLNLYLGNGKFKRITKKDGLIANSVMGITEDEEGSIWITTYIGTSQLNLENNAIQNFDFHTKQNNNQFNQMSILTTSKGLLLFGGINGLNSVKLEHIKKNYANPEIIFTKFKIFNKAIESGPLLDGRTILKQPIEVAETIYLDYYDNSFSFEFTATDYTNPLSFNFKYKMEGFNSEWQQTEEGIHSTSYTNLDPGNYTFKVKLMDKEIAVQVIIAPPYWDTLWFKLLSALIILSLFIGTAYFFLKRREETHQQKLLEVESEILQLKNEKLATEVNSKNAKLMFSSIQMAHKNEVLTVVKKDLEKGMPNPNNEIRSLLRMIDSELENEDYWKDFNVYFNQVDREFVKSLNKKHPNLTQNDIRICTLIRLQLTTKKIASLLNVTTRGVEKSRSRLKKRLELGQEQNLLKYILDFDSV